MSQTSTLKDQCIVEFLDIGLLVFFGIGRVATLKVAKANFGQWEISIIWGLDVAMTIYLITGVSSMHPNPAVTIALWLFTCFDGRKVIPFIILQFAGAFRVATLAYGLYYSPFLGYETTHHMVRGGAESLDLASIFLTYPNPHINFMQAFAVEMVITIILMDVTLALTNDSNGMPHGPFAPLLIGLLITMIGASMGPLTGSAINPARDIGPKTFTWLVDWGDVAFTGSKDIPYLLVPLCAPVVGAVLSVFSYRKLIGRHLSYDTCVDEEQQSPSSSTTQHRASL